MSISAVQHIRRMRGAAQGHLMRCSDEHLYIVKFRNNPQHPRVLANELLATRLAECAGLPVPVTMIVEVGKWLVKHTPELHVQLPHGVIQCQPGLQFGSRYVTSLQDGPVFDYFPAKMLGRVQNLEAFVGMLIIDKWTGNTDLRQAAFWRRRGEPTYTGPSSIREIVSMRATGLFPMILCVECTRTMKCMPECEVGNRLSHGSRGSKPWRIRLYGGWQRKFLRNGTGETGTNLKHWSEA